MGKERFRTYLGEEQGTEVEIEIRRLDGGSPSDQVHTGRISSPKRTQSKGDSVDKAEMEAIQKFINHMLQYTSNIIYQDQNGGQPKRFRSGMVIRRNNRYFMLTAAHQLVGGVWAVETNVTLDDKRQVLVIPLRGIQQPDPNCDAALCELDLEALLRQAEKDPHLSGKKPQVQFYCGPLDHIPKPGEAYGFAAWNQCIYLKDLSILERNATYEVGMTFNGMDRATGLYEFKLAGKHKGHDAYYGASGAPIAEPDGKIVSIVLEGNVERDVILGLPLASFSGHIPK
jgi:hypothetical protein